MIYVKYKDFKGTLKDGETLLISNEEFDNGGKDVMGVPVSITPDGEEPVDMEEIV